MYFEQNPVINVHNYRQQDLQMHRHQVGPTYKSFNQSDLYTKPLLPYSPKVDCFADIHKPIYDFNKRF